MPQWRAEPQPLAIRVSGIIARIPRHLITVTCYYKTCSLNTCYFLSINTIETHLAIVDIRDSPWSSVLNAKLWVQSMLMVISVNLQSKVFYQMSKKWWLSKTKERKIFLDFSLDVENGVLFREGIIFACFILKIAVPFPDTECTTACRTPWYYPGCRLGCSPFH